MELDALIAYLFRWIHFFAGIAWIGLLYYFNFVQTEYFKEADPAAKASAISKLVPRALGWFRYGALFTFLSGLALAGFLGAATNFYISIGMLLGTLMFLNVWLIIWPNQKTVIASNEQVLAGGEPMPEAAAALGRARRDLGNALKESPLDPYAWARLAYLFTLALRPQLNTAPLFCISATTPGLVSSR